MTALVTLRLGRRRFEAVAPRPNLTASRTTGTVRLQPLIDLRRDSAGRVSDHDAVMTLAAYLDNCPSHTAVVIVLGGCLPTTRLGGVVAERLATGGDVVLQLAPHAVPAWRDWARTAGWVVTE